MKSKRAFHAVALAGLGLLWLGQASSFANADTIRRARVVSLEESEAFFALEPDWGIAPAQSVRIKHPIRLKHPVTGVWVEDELPVGEASITMVGKRLAMVVLAPALRERVVAGDVVEVLVLGGAKAPAVEAKPEQREPLPESDKDTLAVLATWQRTSGQRLDTRIEAWREFLRDHPESTYRERIEADIVMLEDMRTREPQNVVFDEPHVPGLDHQGPSMVDAGERLGLAFVLENSAAVVAAWIHYRRVGDPTFHREVLRKDGDGYLRGAIEPKEVLSPGIEYFVEVAHANGQSGSAIGSAEEPRRIRVQSQSLQALRETRNRSRVSVIATYLDYGTFDDRGTGDEYTDRFALFETDFLFRLRRPWLYGVRVGMGVLSGEGGFKDRPEPESAGFQYGYTEFEFRTKPTRAYLARLIAGLGRDGLGFGAEGRVRFGEEEASNLSFALSSLEDVGFLSEVRMQWAAIASMPIGFSVGVTDQPNNGDLGVRLSGDLGYRALDWFQPTVRISYQGRSIQHSGLGVGLGMVFDW